MRRARYDWIAPVFAALGFLALAAVFAVETVSFRRAVALWASRDLAARTELAARTLAEPLATQDFRALHAFGRACADDGVRLKILAPGGGIVFDTREPGPPPVGGDPRAPRAPCVTDDTFASECPCGEYRVALALPASRVLRPFRRAMFGFLLAGLLGVTGMLLLFFTAYRQRARLRELARLERFRSEFVADVSHEIKTPLTGILGCVDLLASDDALPDAMRRKLCGMLKRESERLNALAQDVVALTRLDETARDGGLAECAPTDLAALVTETAERFKPEADAAHMTVRVEAPAAVVVSCDAALVERALANLVRNAIRHSESPDVLIAAASASEHGKSGAELVVEDHGVGIPPESRARIFERFYRPDAARARDTGGSGLGLAIVRRIARLHGGDVTLAEAAPHGCRFRVFIAPPRVAQS